MEEKPPTQAGRDVPRSRTPRSTFGTPDQPTPPSKPAERAPRRSKAAPAVSFQAPANDESTSPEATPGHKPTQRRPQSGDAPAKKAPAAKATPPEKRAAEPGEPAKATAKPAAKHAPGSAGPAKDAASAAAEAARPAKAAAKAAPPAKKAAAEPAKATPAKRAPKKVPGQAEAVEPAASRTPARAKKAAKAAAASEKKAAPAQPAADATPPAKAMPAAQADVTEDPAPAQAIADATPPAKAAPAQEPERAPALRTDKPAVRESMEAELGQPTALSQLVADPGHAPELLALTAVQTIGPRAKEWATRTREAYPKATDAALARLAADQFTRITSPTSIVAAVAGSFAPSALIATTALTHARVILHVAAAYGLDPTDEARAADLLVLTRVYASREDAEAALSTTTQRGEGLRRIARMIATNAAGWVAVRLVRRYFPGTSLLAAALVSRSSARNMAERANTYYSQASQALGSSV